MGKRIEFIKEAFSRPWVRVVWAIFAFIGAWDTVGAQFLPRSLQSKWPTIYELAMLLSGFMPWWGWVIAALILALLVTIEYGVRNIVAFSTGPLIDMKEAVVGDIEPTKKWHENITWKRWFWTVPAGLAVVGIVAWVFLYPKEIVVCNAKFEWLDKIDVGEHDQRGTYLIQYAIITPLTPEPYWMDIKADGGGLVGLAIFQNGKISQPWQLLPQGIGARFYNPRGGVGIVAFAPKPADVIFKEPEFRCANGTRKIPKP